MASVLAALDRYPLVALAERHLLQEIHDFRCALLLNPALPDKLTDIVVEFGNALYQDIAERFILGDQPVAPDELARLWRFTIGGDILWDAPIYEGFFRAVRAVNWKRPPDRRIRILVGDPSFDHRKVRGVVDKAYVLSAQRQRDGHYAAVVEHEVLRKGRRALLIAGSNHLLRGLRSGDDPKSANAATLLSQRYPGALYVIDPLILPPGVQQDPLLRQAQTAVAGWPRTAVAPLADTWLGETTQSVEPWINSAAYLAGTPGAVRYGAQADAVLPPSHGTPAADWRVFRQTYTTIAAHLPRDERIRASVAQAAITGMTASLHDDHTRYAPPLSDTGGNPPGAAGQGDFDLALRLSADPALPDRATPPVFIIGIDPGSPADRAGLQLGDVITAVNGLPPAAAGVVDQAVPAQLEGPAPTRLMVRRPESGRVMTVSVTPAPYPAPQPVWARILPGHLAYVRLTSFVDNAANFVIAAVDGLGLGRRLRGVVLDLRGNEGGSAAEPPRLLGAFTHHEIVAYYENGRGRQTAIWTDDTMPLLGVPLVALIDRGCASACDVTAAAIHDLRLGRLVGERTAGDVAGPAEPWFLGDGGVLQIPVAFMRGAKGEIEDGIGVPPDEEVAASPAALSAGRDIVLDRALADLGG